MRKASETIQKEGYNNIFALNFRLLMNGNGEKITQQSIAQYLGCSRQAISQYMNGEAIPDAEKLIKISKYFNVSIDFLLGATTISTNDTTLAAVCEYTGLSESTISKIVGWKKEKGTMLEQLWGYSPELKTSILDKLISCPTFETLIDHIATYRSELTELMHDICVLKSQTGSEDFDMNKLPELENRFRASRCDYYDGLHSFEECIIYQTENDYNYIQGNIDEIYEFLLTTRLPGEKAVEEDGEHN